jgi:hypothetical protein
MREEGEGGGAETISAAARRVTELATAATRADGRVAGELITATLDDGDGVTAAIECAADVMDAVHRSMAAITQLADSVREIAHLIDGMPSDARRGLADVLRAVVNKRGSADAVAPSIGDVFDALQDLAVIVEGEAA